MVPPRPAGAKALLLALLLVAGVAAPAAGEGTAATAVESLKPPMQGLVDRESLPPGSWSSARGGPIQAVVLRVRWADLQGRDGTVAAANPIEERLASLPGDLKLKVRILAGADAPRWLLESAGTVRLSDPQSGTRAVLRWWTAEAKEAYDSLVRGLAARYDGDERIVDFTVSRCSTFTAEPLLRPLGSATNRKTLWEAGLRAAADGDNDRQCQVDALAAHTAFRLTRSSLALNPYQQLVSPSSSRVDVEYTEELMRACRSVLGTRCVLANHSLRQRSRGPAYDRMYRSIESHGAPITFQTAGASNFKTCSALRAVVSTAVGRGANAVELPFNYVKLCAPRDLAGEAAALRGNVFP